MITAEKKLWFTKLFAAYQRYYLFPKHFTAVTAYGAPSETPAVYIANHSSWWDGLIIFQSTEKLSNQDHYMLMAEKGLKAYPFFKKLAAFSVDKNRIRDVMRSLRYAKMLLEEGKSVWIFPQGSIQHQEIRPFFFRRVSGAC